MRPYIVISGDKFYYVAEQTADKWLWRLMPAQFDELLLARSVAALFEEHGAWKKAWPPMMTAADIGIDPLRPDQPQEERK